jgi:hypothetical protein
LVATTSITSHPLKHDARDPGTRHARREGSTRVGTPTTPHPAGLASPLALPTAYDAAFDVLAVSFFAFVLVLDFSSTPVRADLELLPTSHPTSAHRATMRVVEVTRPVGAITPNTPPRGPAKPTTPRAAGSLRGRAAPRDGFALVASTATTPISRMSNRGASGASLGRARRDLHIRDPAW